MKKTATKKPVTAADDRLAKTDVFVWTDTYGRHSLWSQWSKKALKEVPETIHAHPARGLERVDWKEDLVGFGPTIGKLDKRPLNLSLFWATVNGVSVCFIEFVSELADFALAEKWLRDRAPRLRGDSTDFYDGMNFVNAIFPPKPTKAMGAPK